MEAKLKISAKRVTIAMALVLVVLVVMGFGLDYLKYGLGREIRGITYLFDFDQKTNFPTAFKLFGLLASAALLWVIAAAKRRAGDQYVTHWRILSLIFIYLTMDEEARLHQMLGRIVRSIVHSEGIFYHGWVLIYLPLVAFFALAYLRFFFDLPGPTRVLFFLAGVCYAGGSGGVELAKGYFETHYGGSENLGFAMIADTSDTLECIGLVIFVNVLLTYLSKYVGEAHFKFADQVAS